MAKRLSGISREAEPKLHAAAVFAGRKKDDVVIEKLVHD